jgi:hypothetical protein
MAGAGSPVSLRNRQPQAADKSDRRSCDFPRVARSAGKGMERSPGGGAFRSTSCWNVLLLFLSRFNDAAPARSDPPRIQTRDLPTPVYRRPLQVSARLRGFRSCRITGNSGARNLPLAARPRVGHIDAQRSCGRVAEGGGLLNRYRVVKPYRGFESLRLRHILLKLLRFFVFLSFNPRINQRGGQ